MSGINDERYEVAGAIRCINFSGEYDMFCQQKGNTKAIERHKGIIKYTTKEVDIPTEDKAYNDEDKMNIMKVTPRRGIYLS